MKINTNLETLVAVHTHTHTHTDVQLENKNTQKTYSQKEKVNNFKFPKYNIRNKIKKGVNSLCIQIHKLSLLSFLRLWKNYVLQLTLQLSLCQKLYAINKNYTEGGNM